jgi:pimeloyl-ACP methyl ester carboxylesterase
MPKAKVGELQLYYEIHGRGEPLVLIPGLGTGAWLWHKQVEAFAQKFRVIVFDPRGVGQSDQPTGEMSIKTIADDVAGLLGALDLERAHILGGSMGGFVAQEFALAYPRLTGKLVLCCTSFGGPRHVPPPASVLEAIASTAGLNTEERARRNLLLSFSARYMEEMPAEIERILALRRASPISESAYMGQIHAAINFNTEARLKAIQAPTLIITGDADTLVPAENSRNLAAAIPCAKLVVIEGGSHQFFIERAGEFNRAVLVFLCERQADAELKAPLSNPSATNRNSL